MSKTRFRCAIYTRKSTEEGLDQAFNTLDAQREACAAYIKSQASLGWKLITKPYDDGGLSGGTMDRPALQDLLEDIKLGRVDVVIVYKIDRLTRSLLDFARIVEVFDRHEVSFVSVTQQFNTTTSMGRLTLNVLLSFAQFEREVTSERIRDKIAASKKKGMWMGGPVPMGYRVEDKRLVIDPEEADLVRQLFDLYLELRSAPRLKERVDELGLTTPRRQTHNGQSGGKSFSLGHLYWILSNPLYAGDVHHQGKIWPGQHEAIIARHIWDAVQKQLQDNKIGATTRSGRKSLLIGRLFDETGDRLSPSHTVRSGRRYRYYVSRRLVQARRKDEAGWRLPAEQLEKVVLTFLTDLLRDERRLARLIGHRDPALIGRALEGAAQLVASGTETLADKRGLVTSIIAKIVIAPQILSLTLSHAGLCRVLGIPALDTPEPSDTVVDLPFTLRRRRVETKLVLAGERQAALVDAKLIQAVAQAHEWLDRLIKGISVADLARELGLDDGEISRVLSLAFLAPDIIAAILNGSQPVELTTKHLKRLKPLPLAWAEQRQRLGFPPAQ
jgi:DNA invertase Pin-like site-specific DNA recombinase